MATAPIITVGNDQTDKSTDLNIQWNETSTNSGIYTPGSRADGGVASFDKLTIKYEGTANPTSDCNTATGDNTSCAITIKGSGATPVSIKATDSTIKMGSNDKGTLEIDFKSTSSNEFNLVANGSTSNDFENNPDAKYAFIGNIVTSGGSKTSGKESIFYATFGKNVKGNITLNNGSEQAGKTVVFNNNSSLEGNLSVGGQNAKIEFKQGTPPQDSLATITGNVSKTSGINLEIAFEEGGEIEGDLNSNGQGSIGSTKIAFGGGDTNTMHGIYRVAKEEVFTPPENGQAPDRGTTTITLKGSVTNAVGMALSVSAGTNKIDFASDTSDNTIQALVARVNEDSRTDASKKEENKKKAQNIVTFGATAGSGNKKNTITNGIFSDYGINVINIKKNDTDIGGRLLSHGGIISINDTSTKQVSINGDITTDAEGSTVIKATSVAINANAISTGSISSSDPEAKDVMSLVAENGSSITLKNGINTLLKNSQTNIKLGKTGQNLSSSTFSSDINNFGQTNISLENTELESKTLTNFAGSTNLVLNASNTSGSYLINNLSGTTNVALSNLKNDKTTIFDINRSGGEVNLIFSSKDDSKKQDFIQAPNNAQPEDPLASEDFDTIQNSTKISDNKVLGTTHQGGIKLTLQDVTTKVANQSMPIRIESKLTGTNQSDFETTLTGIATGSLSSIDAVDADKNHIFTLNQHSAFIGDLSFANNKANLVMKDGSKLVVAGKSNHSKVQNLTLDKDIAFDSAQNTQNIFGQTNAVISLTTGINDTYNAENRTDFRLLEIGKKDDKTANQGFIASNENDTSKAALFQVYVNNTEDKTTLGKTGEANNTGVGNTYGTNHYSDRIVIHNAGDNSKTSTQNLQIIFDAKTDLNSIHYQQGKGTETKGNIAIATVVNKANNPATQTTSGKESKDGVVDFKTTDSLLGFDVVQSTLTGVYTDQYGQVKVSATNANQSDNEKNNYTTYFLSNAKNIGISQAHIEASTLALETNYDLYLANFNSLNKRMGELRNNPDTQGAWLRIFNGSQNNDFSLSKNLYTTLQGGYDYAFKVDGASNYVGFAISYVNSSSKIQEAGQKFIDLNGVSRELKEIQSNGVEFALYNAYIQDEGWYNDSIAKLSYISSTFKKDAQSHETKNLGFSLSNEVGYRFKLGDEKTWFIDPQVELAFGYLDQSSFNQTLGIHTLKGVADALYTLRSRAGAAFGYDFKSFTQDSPVNASLYLGAFYEYDYIRGGKINLTTSKTTDVESKFKSDGRFVLNAGTNLEIKDHTRLYFDFEKSFGGKITTDYQVNVGVRYSFGEKVQNNLIKEAPKKQEAIQPLKEQDKETTKDQEAK